MNEPRRYLDHSPSSPAYQLLRAAAEQPVPKAALARAAKRFGVSGALLAASSAAVAEAAIAPSLSAGTAVTGSAGIGTATVTFTFVKAVALGLGLGASALGGAHWVSVHGPAAQTAPHASTSASPAVQRLPPQPSSRAFALAQPAPAIASVESVRVTNSVNPPVQTRELVAQPSVSQLPAEQPHLQPVESAVAVKALPPAEQPLVQVPASGPSLLAREVHTLDAVRAALSQGDAIGALRHLDEAARQKVFQVLTREALVLRVEALGRAGRTIEAAALARQLSAQLGSPSQRRILERWLQPKSD